MSPMNGGKVHRITPRGLRYPREVGVHRLSQEEARRIAVRAQLLDAPRPTDLLAVVRQLTLLQIDPTAAIAPSADLVAWSRLGSSYQPAHLQKALELDRTLFELNAMVRPMSDLGLHLAEMAAWPSYEKQRVWLRQNERFRRDILDRLEASGPLLSRDIPDTSVVAWPSSGVGTRMTTGPRLSHRIYLWSPTTAPTSCLSALTRYPAARHAPP